MIKGQFGAKLHGERLHTFVVDIRVRFIVEQLDKDVGDDVAYAQNLYILSHVPTLFFRITFF